MKINAKLLREYKEKERFRGKNLNFF